MSTDDASSPQTDARNRPAPAARVGVIGLGSMGLPMARHLLEAHGALTVHSRSRKQEILDAGATWADTPRELAASCDAVLVMLPDLPQLEPMLEGPDGLLAVDGELLLMIGSSSSPVAVRELGERLAGSSPSGASVRVVDCPVSGGESGAQEGALSIMLGGPDGDAALAAELLRPCGTVRHLGPLGAGEVTKACNQMIVGATMMALADATVLAQRSGVAPADLFDALDGGYAGSNLMRIKRGAIEADDYRPGGVAAYMVKDLGFAQEVAEATGTDAALLPRLRALYEDLVEAGLGDQDLAVAKRFVEDR
jgi:2-hydroxy-3-oxopropionate reductase